MSYIPALPSGYTGWLALKRSGEKQMEVFSNLAQTQRTETYVRENIGKITSADALMKDYRLLKVSLEAYGLEDDLPNRYFINRVLSEGTLTEGALSLKLSDPRYRALSSAFGFGDFAKPNTQLSDFSEKLLSAWRERSFETAVGAVDDNLRLGLNAQRELKKIVSSTHSTELTKWYSILGQKPLRKIFDTAYGLPASFGALDLERQVKILQKKTESYFGSPDLSQFTDPDQMEKLVRRFILQAGVGSQTQNLSTRGSAALALLTGGGR